MSFYVTRSTLHHNFIRMSSLCLQYTYNICLMVSMEKYMGVFNDGSLLVLNIFYLKVVYNSYY